MELVNFIKEHSDWREVLSKKPYSIKIKDDGPYTLFMYNQIESDFYNPIVKECRGVILDISGEEPRVVCRAFDKFGNYGEGYADEIDWESARVQEKVDGSIMKLWFDNGKWHVSTNSCIDAFKANLSNTNLNFGSLFTQAFPTELLVEMDQDYTYIFELVSPYNRVVINYGKTAIYSLGKRNNLTGEEVDAEDLGLPRPDSYPLSSLEDCIEAAAALNDMDSDEVNYEGFVVVDKFYHRIKIKSPLYVSKHHVLTKTPSLTDLVIVYLRNETEEFLTYFPNYWHAFNLIYFYFSDLNYYLFKARLEWGAMNKDRKEFALAHKGDPFSRFYFDAIKYEDWSIERVKALPHEELARIIKNYYGDNI